MIPGFKTVFFANKPANNDGSKRRSAGVGLIDVVVGVGIVSLLFVAIFGLFRSSISVILNSKAKAGAVALLEERMEYIRSLDYDSVGTQAGIPAGPIPQIENIRLNNTDFTRRVFIQNYDSPQDGMGASDQNSVQSDYKRVKVTLSWQDSDGQMRDASAVTTVAPPGVESDEGGGTLRINAIDATSQPVANAEVRILNSGVNPAVDVTTYTNSDGVAQFSGSTEGAGYEITVGKGGFSTAQTYTADAGNPNPDPPHLSVTENKVTGASFAIDELIDFTLTTRALIDLAVFTEAFDDTSALSEQEKVVVESSQLRLDTIGTSSAYATSGRAVSQAITENNVWRWQQLKATSTTPGTSELRFQLLYDDGSATLEPIPDADLSGNSTGFATTSLDLSSLSTSSYQTIYVAALLDRGGVYETPVLEEWSLDYETGGQLLPNTAVAVRGNKTIGEDASGELIYKYVATSSTDSQGVWGDGLEWDEYQIGVIEPGLMVYSLCPAPPVGLDPGTTDSRNVFIATSTEHSLRVTAKDGAADVAISGATVNLTHSDGYDETKTTDRCGQAIFTNLTERATAQGYELRVSADEYQSASETGVGVSSQSNVVIELMSN